MMKAALALVVLGCLGGVAGAQPGATPPSPSPGGGPPYPTYGYPPQPQPQLQLTADEMDTLSIGYITDGQLIGGGLASLFIGFGVAQAIEGRWHDTGWIFTLGEPAAFGVMLYGVFQAIGCIDNNCSGNHNTGETAAVIGAVTLVGLRVWEIIDAFTGPGRHNARWTALQQRMGNPVPQYVRPFVAPAAGGGAVVGLSLRF